MFVIAGILVVAPDYIQLMQEMIDELVPVTRARDGCLHYSILFEDRAGGVVNVLEIWRDDAALAKHMAEPRTQKYFVQLGPQLIKNTCIIYDVAGTRPLFGRLEPKAP
jgi:quinol monooxygenase YgiN